MSAQADLDFAHWIAARVGEVPGIVAVVLGGSRGRGTADANSDFDLGLYYRRANPFSPARLSALAQELDDRHLPDLATDFGGWGRWVNGGAWLIIGGRHLDFIYRDLDRVAETIAECRAGRPTADYHYGHPHGFHNHIYMAEVHTCRPLFDPTGEIERLKALTAEYPPLLRSSLIERSLDEAAFFLQIADKPAARGEVFYVSGCVFRAVACMVQALYALNRRYFLNEKGSMREVESFQMRPAGFGKIVSSAMASVGSTPDELTATLGRINTLLEAVRGLTKQE